MRVLVTGSRDWRDAQAVFTALDTVAAAANIIPPAITVIHGDCPTGADAHAKVWTARNFAHPEEHPANWREYGQSAGFKRNVQMVESGVDLCLVFVRPCRSEHCTITEVHGSHGTMHCARVARDANVPITTYQEGWA